MPSPHIIIIGGGIGGLALARGLRKNNIPFTIFERDTTPISRSQGYRVRIAGEGAQALFDCLGDEHWDLFEKTCAEMKFGASSLNALDCSEMPAPGPPAGIGGRLQERFKIGDNGPQMTKVNFAYTVDRTMLRALLLLNQDKNVKFGKAFTHYETTPSGVRAFFADGTSAEGSLLVGADGIASPVRKQLLPNQKYVDTNLRAIYGKTPITNELQAKFTPEAMKHMTIIKDHSVLAFLEPVRFPSNIPKATNNRLPQVENYVYWVFGAAKESLGGTDEEFRHLSGKEAADLTKSLTASWHPSIKPLFELQDEKQAAPLRLLSSKPQKPDFSPNSKVTLIGDAVHTMMPAGGSGANIALSDASLLLRILVETFKRGEEVNEKAMRRFWDGMWDVALPAVEASAQGAVRLFGFKGFECTKEVEL